MQRRATELGGEYGGTWANRRGWVGREDELMLQVEKVDAGVGRREGIWDGSRQKVHGIGTREQREEWGDGGRTMGVAWPGECGFSQFFVVCCSFFLFVVYIYIFKRPIIIEHAWQQPAHNYGSVSSNQEAHRHLPVEKRLRILLFI